MSSRRLGTEALKCWGQWLRLCEGGALKSTCSGYCSQLFSFTGFVLHHRLSAVLLPVNHSCKGVCQGKLHLRVKKSWLLQNDYMVQVMVWTIILDFIEFMSHRALL